MYKVMEKVDFVVEYLRFKLLMKDLNRRYKKDNLCDTALKCHEFLIKFSRSFVIVILSLNADLSHAVCIYYLVLRALDTIEDDPTIALTLKLPMLKDFYTHLEDPDWSFMESNDKDKQVLEEFFNVSKEFIKFDPVIKEIISNICHEMGDGMAEFLQKRIVTIEDWEKYCYYVAGLVGLGLTRLFVTISHESETLLQDEKLPIAMGLFLQQTNIIRDIREDTLDSRHFWPLQLIEKYMGSADNYDKLLNTDDYYIRHLAIACANELITIAIGNIPATMEYMGQIHDPSIYRFCAIPQVMALATLTLCYNNGAIFERNVKIARYETVKIFNNCQTHSRTKTMYTYYLTQLKNKMLRARQTYNASLQTKPKQKQLDFLLESNQKNNGLVLQQRICDTFELMNHNIERALECCHSEYYNLRNIRGLKFKDPSSTNGAKPKMATLPLISSNNVAPVFWCQKDFYVQIVNFCLLPILFLIIFIMVRVIKRLYFS